MYLKLHVPVPRLWYGECPGKRDWSPRCSRQSCHQETCPLDWPGRNLPVRLSGQVGNDIFRQASAGSRDLHTKALAWASSASLPPPHPPSEGLPDSLRLCWSEWPARRQGLVCVNDMWSCGPGVDSPRVDQWHAVCQGFPRGFKMGCDFLNRNLGCKLFPSDLRKHCF